jgi:DNA-directed RNA polymerase sigma subunit (sigma70/sigma32)
VAALASSEISQEEEHARSQHSRRVKTIVHVALETFDQRERHIVELRVMADAEECQSLIELGRFLGVSRDRARQIEMRAKRKPKQGFFEAANSNSCGGLQAGAAAWLAVTHHVIAF